MKVEVKALLQTHMNSINNDWDSTKRTKRLYCGPSSRTREKGKQEEKTLRMGKSKYTSETGHFGQRLLTIKFLSICQSVFTCSVQI